MDHHRWGVVAFVVVASGLGAGCGGGEAGDPCEDGRECGSDFYCLYRHADDAIGECVDAPGSCETPVGCGCKAAGNPCEDEFSCSDFDDDPVTITCR